jgi:hypothetical protein
MDNVRIYITPPVNANATHSDQDSAEEDDDNVDALTRNQLLAEAEVRFEEGSEVNICNISQCLLHS